MEKRLWCCYKTDVTPYIFYMWGTNCPVFWILLFCFGHSGPDFSKITTIHGNPNLIAEESERITKIIQGDALICRSAQILWNACMCVCPNAWLTVLSHHFAEGGKFAAARKAPGKHSYVMTLVDTNFGWDWKELAKKNIIAAGKYALWKSTIYLVFDWFSFWSYIFFFPRSTFECFQLFCMSHKFSSLTCFLLSSHSLAPANLSATSFTAGMRRRARLVRRHHKPREWIRQRGNTFGLTAETTCIFGAPGRVLEN